MIGTLLAAAVLFGGGFACGRVKNAAKLKAANDLLVAAQGKAGAEAADLIAKAQAAVAANKGVIMTWLAKIWSRA
jgi:3-hydroxyisobutyrate dehydrogenase-like beta-hydroxyacid dehydrogenase